MKYETYLRDELLKATHRWPMIFLFGILGSLVGFAAAYLWPSPYRATKELYIGIEVQNAMSDADVLRYSGVQYSNINDFKNWQMANLNTMITMQPVLEETLDILQEGDSYWQGVTWQELKEMLHVYWRNAGKWQLVAETQDALRAVQAVTAWESVVVQTAQRAIDAGLQALVHFKELNTLITEQREVETRLQKVESVYAALWSWQENLSTLPESAPLSETDRLSIWNLVLSIAMQGNPWETHLASFPQSSAPVSHYLQWIQEVKPVLEVEAFTLKSLIASLRQQQSEVEQAFSEASQQSLGLSASLRLEKVGDQPAQVRAVRPIGAMLLAGCTLGLLTWMFLWLIQTNLR